MTTRPNGRRLAVEPLEPRLAPAVRVWTGAGPIVNWSVSSNWGDGLVPAAGDDVVFPAGTPAGKTDYDLPADLTLRSVRFDAPGVVVFGDPVRLSGGVQVTYQAGSPTRLASAVTLTATQTFTVDRPGATLELAGPVDVGTSLLTVAGKGAVDVSGALASAPAGGGGLALTGTGRLTLRADSPGFGGSVQIAGGVLQVAAAGALGGGTTGTVVLAGGTLEVVGGVRPNEPLAVAGSGAGGGGAVQFLPDGGGWAGPVQLLAGATVGVEAGTATLSGPLTGDGGLVKVGPGRLTLAGANTSAGRTDVRAGTLRADAALTADVLVGAGAVLEGTGQVGRITPAGGTVRPGGDAAGTLTAAGLDAGVGTLAVAPGRRLAVTGTADVDGLALDLQADPATPTGTPVVILANDGSTPVAGTFAGLPEGGTLGVGGRAFTVSYQGGDGNDVTVIPTGAPATPPASPAGQFAVGSGGPGGVRVYNPDGSQRATLDPFGGFTGGVRTAAADFNRDGVADVVAGTGPGRATRVVVLDGKTQAELFVLDPFEAAFTGGVFVAAGDLTADGVADLVISPDEGGGPRVRVFSGKGFVQLADFFGIDDTNFRGGARAAVGDVNGDRVGDLVVAAGFGGGPRVAVFDGRSLRNGAYTGRLVGDFFAFEDTLRNGVYVTVGDLDGDGQAEVVAGGGPGGGPRVSAFSAAGLLRGEQARVADFFAGDPASRGGVSVAVKNLDDDGRADLVAGAGTGAGNRVTAYTGRAMVGGGLPDPLFAFDAFPGFTSGVFVG